MTKAVRYYIGWHWKDNDTKMHDYVMATNAERAINKHYRNLSEEFTFDRGDIIIIAVSPE